MPYVKLDCRKSKEFRQVSEVRRVSRQTITTTVFLTTVVFFYTNMRVLESKLEADILRILPTNENNEDLEFPEACENFVQLVADCDDSMIFEMKEKGYKLHDLIFLSRNSSQIRLGLGKKCDILSSWQKMYLFEKDGEINDVKINECVIFEIKAGAIDLKAVEQILRYKEAICKLSYYDKIRLFLIGNKVGDISSVLNNLKVNIELFTYEYNKDGLVLNWFDKDKFIDNSIGFCNKFLANEMFSYSKRVKEYGSEISFDDFLEQGYIQKDLYEHTMKK